MKSKLILQTLLIFINITFAILNNIASIELNSEAFRINMNKQNNEIIVIARDYFFKISAQKFEIIDRFDTKSDNTTTASQLFHPDSDDKVLLIKYNNPQFPLLLVGDYANYVIYADKFSGANKCYFGNNWLEYICHKIAFFAHSFPTSKSVVYLAYSHEKQYKIQSKIRRREITYEEEGRNEYNGKDNNS